MIWIAAGTEEGRRIAKALIEKNRKIMVSVTTEYGGSLLKKELQKKEFQKRELHEKEFQKTELGREKKAETNNNDTKNWTIIDRALDYEEMGKILQEFPITKIVDATHPYADKVSNNLITLAKENNISYFRYERPSLKDLLQRETGEHEKKNILWVKNTGEAIEALRNRQGNVLLTTGSKTLGDYLKVLETSRIYARVLPVPKVMEECRALGLPAGQILGMQGPFSTEFNQATLEEYNIEALVTKDSGVIGGVLEKIRGALKAKAKIIIIDRPDVAYPKVFSDMKALVEQL